MDNQHDLPTDDALDMTERKCPPPDHAERCRKMAADMANAEQLLYRLANGDRDAAIKLKWISEHRTYDGCMLVWRIEELLFNVLE